LKQILLWCLALCFSVYIQASNMDIYNPVGEKRSCNTKISSLLQQAYNHYPSISSSEKLILAAQAEIEGAKWNYFPTPSIDFSQGSAGRTGQTYRIDQPLWTGGKLDALNDLAYARGNEAQYALQESAYTLSKQVLRVVNVMIRADGEIKAFERGKKDLQSLSKMLERRVEAGVSSETDSDLVESRIFQIDSDILTSKQRFKMAERQLQLLTGRSVSCLKLKNDSNLKTQKSLDSMFTNMIQTHPSLKKKTAQIAKAKAQRKAADAEIMPNLSLRAEHQRGSLYQDYQDTSNTIVYVAVSFNPGAGLSSLSNMESAKYKMMKAQDDYRTTEQELNDELIRYYTDYKTAQRNLDTIKQTIVSSRKVLDSYERLFLAGKRQWLDLVNMSREVTMNYVSLASLRAMMIVSSYNLQLQTGHIYLNKKMR